MRLFFSAAAPEFYFSVTFFGEENHGIRAYSQTSISSRAILPIIADVLQNISRLAVQDTADCVQCAEADRSYFSCFQAGEVDIGDANLCGKVIQFHFPVRENPVKTNNNHNV